MVLTKIIPSYLYQEYSDDADIQALVDAWNQIAQTYVDWFNSVNLPIYTGPVVSGSLLDWVGQGLYGVTRPVLPFGVSSDDGLYNALQFNELAFNETNISNASSFVTTDDIYRRVITWAFFKGDGRQFTIPWLKRRIMRFLLGVDGINFNVDKTYDISVTFAGTIVNIEVPASYDAAQIFQAAIESGVLEFPFQFTPSVTLV